MKVDFYFKFMLQLGLCDMNKDHIVLSLDS